MTRLLAIVVFTAALCGATAAASAAPLTPPAGVNRLLAPPSACPHQSQPTQPSKARLQAMLCLTNYARTHSKLARIKPSKQLTQAAAGKVGDILRCDEFSHEACGREFTYWMKQSGYLQGDCWGAAENIAWGTGTIGTPRAIMRAWLHSPGHRENILGPYTDIGIGLREGAIEGTTGAHVWVQEFGSHAC